VATDPKLPAYLEIGPKRTFACAVDWPGWSRGGRDQASALQALFDYGKRYGKAVSSARLGFEPPGEMEAIKIVERLKGDTTTDFGSPGAIPAADEAPVDEAELRRLQAILKACWRTFDRVAAASTGRTLRLGARGGGREQQKILEHVFGAEHAYATALGWKLPFLGADPTPEQLKAFRKGILEGLTASAHGELPLRGPRGGRRWPARYFVRRSAWHLLDHAWEIEDRLE
jgi:hypothetical protein